LPAIRTQASPSGEIFHLVPHAAAALPAVTKRDLEQAWEAAREAALAAAPPARHVFRFARDASPPLDLALNDKDAASWAGAIDRIADLSTAHGISVCLRLLALVDLMGRATWARAWFTFSRAGSKIHPALLQAAALSPLTDTGGFAETALRALLPATGPDSE
jgi:hypothetical protein